MSIEYSSVHFPPKRASSGHAKRAKKPSLNTWLVDRCVASQTFRLEVGQGSVEDLSLIEPILRTSRDENVIEASLFALSCHLDESEEIPQQLVETISELILHEDIDPRIRKQAIGVFRISVVTDLIWLLLSNSQMRSVQITLNAGISCFVLL